MYCIGTAATAVQNVLSSRQWYLYNAAQCTPHLLKVPERSRVRIEILHPITLPLHLATALRQHPERERCRNHLSSQSHAWETGTLESRGDNANAASEAAESPDPASVEAWWDPCDIVWRRGCNRARLGRHTLVRVFFFFGLVQHAKDVHDLRLLLRPIYELVRATRATIGVST